MEIVVKSLIGILTVLDGKIYLLMDNNNLINFDCNDNVEEENRKYIDNNLDIEDLNLKQCYTFSEKIDEKLLISFLYVDIINYRNIKSNKFTLQSIDSLEDSVYKEKIKEYSKRELVFNSTIKRIYPEEFILPEIQKIYEDLLNKKYDRRNFRKRLIKLDVIEDLNKISENKKGRPAKLYKFKDITEDKILF